MAIENLVSSFISTLDGLPSIDLTTGEGAPGLLQSITDNIAVTATGMGSVGSTYRLCRFPTRAKIKSLIIDLGNVDSGGAGGKFDVNVAFSDDPYDGTPSVFQSATAAQALCIPRTGATGSVTSSSSYSSPNILFGQITAGNNTVSYGNQMLFKGTYTNWFANGINLPLWNFFGFQNAQGQAQDPGGFFDILLYLSTAATTGAAASINVKLDFIL